MTSEERKAEALRLTRRIYRMVLTYDTSCHTEYMLKNIESIRSDIKSGINLDKVILLGYKLECMSLTSQSQHWSSDIEKDLRRLNRVLWASPVIQEEFKQRFCTD